jgi:hypothetical protein
MQQSPSAGNPQPSEMIWLAGFVDGEGHFGLNIHVRSDRNYKQCTPRFVIANTSLRTIERIHDILSQHQVGHLVKEKKIVSPKHRPQKLIVVMGYRRVNRLLDVLKPEYLYTKRKQAELLKAFTDYRIQQETRAMCGLENDVHNMLKQLNHDEGSETIMAASQLIEQIIEKMG